MSYVILNSSDFISGFLSVYQHTLEDMGGWISYFSSSDDSTEMEAYNKAIVSGKVPVWFLFDNYYVRASLPVNLRRHLLNDAKNSDKYYSGSLRDHADVMNAARVQFDSEKHMVIHTFKLHDQTIVTGTPI